MDEKSKIRKHGSRWTADENKYLLELWYENRSIADIAETLERTEFAIICQLPWKAEVKLSRVLSEISDKKQLGRTSKDAVFVRLSRISRY